MPDFRFRDRNADILTQHSLPVPQRPTLAALSKRYGVSPERIRQIEYRERHRKLRVAAAEHSPD